MIKLIKNILNLEMKDKTIFLLIITTSINVLIAFIKFVFAFSIPSLWFFVNACFLTVLSLARFFSIKDYIRRKNIKNEKIKRNIGYKNYLNNGILLIILGIIYFFVSVYIYYKGSNTTIHEYLTYLVALNAFWSISCAIRGIIKYKRNDSPILKAIKLTNFANALTSIVLTQVVLLDTYAKDFDLQQINGYTGMFVSIIIIIMGLSIIINEKEIE